MKQIHSKIIKTVLTLGLLSTVFARSQGPFDVKIRKLRINDNKAKLYPVEDVKEHCFGGYFNFSLEEDDKKLIYQTLLTYQVSHQFTNLLVYVNWRGDFCDIQRIEIVTQES